MADEAVVRIVFDDEGEPPAPTSPPTPAAQPPAGGTPAPAPAAPASVPVHHPSTADRNQEAKALATGGAMLWSPPDQPISKPGLAGLKPDQEEYLRLESEAARRGQKVKDYRRDELLARAGGAEVPPPRSTAPPPPSTAPPPPPPAPPPIPAPPAAAPPPQPAPPTAPPPAAPQPVSLTDDDDDVEERRNKRLAESAERLRKQFDDLADTTVAQVPIDDGDDDVEERRKKRLADLEERRRKQFDDLPDTTVEPIPVEIVKSKPEPPPAAAPTVPTPAPAAKADPLGEIAWRERYNPTPESAMGKRLAQLKSPTQPEPPDPKQQKKRSDAGFDVLDSLRGTIGGVFGPMAGATLDLVKGFHKANEETDGLTRGLIKTSVVVGAAAAAFKILTGSLDESVKRYAEVNAEVAEAQGMAEAQTAIADIERGERYGADLARYIQSRTDMQIAFEEAKMKLLTQLAPVIEGIFNLLSTFPGILESLPVAIAVAIAVRSGNPLAIGAAALLEISELLSDYRKKDLKDEIRDPADAVMPLYEGNPMFDRPRAGVGD